MVEKNPQTEWNELDAAEREKAAACFFHTVPYVSSGTLRNLKQGLGRLERVFRSSREQLKPFVRTQKALEGLLSCAGQEKTAWEQYVKLCEKGVHVMMEGDVDYPDGLKPIFSPPFLLYWKGDSSIFRQPALGMVGCREATSYGQKQAEYFARTLANAGIVIVSGLARGIDAAAHGGALQVPGGKTIAVLGCGIFNIYPPENRDLFHQIAKCGLLVSEFPPFAGPNPGHFPQRNRIIAALSQGVMVVEAKKKSGALITSDYAMEQGKEVYALPGDVTSPASEGTHRLIQQGAKLVMEPADILEDYRDIIKRDLQQFVPNEQPETEREDAVPEVLPETVPEERTGTVPTEKEMEPETPSANDSVEQNTTSLCREEEMILQALEKEPRNVDEILQQVHCAPGLVLQYILQLEIRGLIESAPGNCYVCSKQ